MALVDLTTLEPPEFNAFLDSFDNVLCDCDGVIWHLGEPVAEIDKSISTLQTLGKKVYFVTNNSYVTITDLCATLRKCNLNVKPEDIVNPCLAVISYLKEIKFAHGICVLGSSDFKQEITRSGFNVVEFELPDMENGCLFGNSSFLDVLHKNLDKIGAVIVDMDLTLNYLKLLKAAICLQNPDVLFLFTCPDKIIPMGRKVTAIGPDYFIKPLQDISQRKPLVFGKPGLQFNEFLVNKCKIDNPSRTLFIGDNLDCDIEFASKSGYQTLLVLTGIAKLQHIDASTDLSKVPDFYINSLGNLHHLITANLNL